MFSHPLSLSFSLLTSAHTYKWRTTRENDLLNVVISFRDVYLLPINLFLPHSPSMQQTAGVF